MRVLSRPLAAATSLAVAVSAVTLAPPAALAADPDITLAKQAPVSVLQVRECNIPRRSATPAETPPSPCTTRRSPMPLPAGMAYVTGSAAPFRDPQISTNAGRQTLVWTDLEDVADGDTLTVGFEVTGGTGTVGTTLTNSAVAVGSTDPRQVPDFGPDGSPQPGPSDKVSFPATATTTVTAIEVEKSEPSPEGELLRGVHKQTTVYTLTVRNNEQAATNGVAVVDFIPAGLEFLGCGGVDNSAPGTEEYPSSGRLGVGTALNPCTEPISVETARDPAGRPAGIYTKVTWQVGNLPARSTREIKYVAGIPLRANALFADPVPTPDSLKQASNLDNNTGASTREQADGGELGLTNTAVVTGTYTGAHTGGTGNLAVTDEDALTVTAEDVRLVKAVSPAQFRSGQVATFTLKVDVSEYVNASAIRVTDTLPDGYCPLGAANYAPGAPSDCDPMGAGPTGASYTSIAPQTDGSYVIAFSDLDIAANGSTTITFPARMRAVYSGTSRAGAATSAGDEFVNNASLNGHHHCHPRYRPPTRNDHPQRAHHQRHRCQLRHPGHRRADDRQDDEAAARAGGLLDDGGSRLPGTRNRPQLDLPQRRHRLLQAARELPEHDQHPQPGGHRLRTRGHRVGPGILGRDSRQHRAERDARRLRSHGTRVDHGRRGNRWALRSPGRGLRDHVRGSRDRTRPTAPSGPHGQPDETAVGEHGGQEGDDPRPGGVRDRPRARGRPAQGRLPGEHPCLRAEQPQHRRVDSPAGLLSDLPRGCRQHGDAPERPGSASGSGLGRAAGGRALLGDLELPLGRPPDQCVEHDRPRGAARRHHRDLHGPHRNEPGRPRLRRHDQAGAHPLDRHRHHGDHHPGGADLDPALRHGHPVRDLRVGAPGQRRRGALVHVRDQPRRPGGLLPAEQHRRVGHPGAGERPGRRRSQPCRDPTGGGHQDRHHLDHPDEQQHPHRGHDRRAGHLHLLGGRPRADQCVQRQP